MRRMSNRLLVRTALLFTLLLIISQVTWIAVGSLIFLKPLRVGYVTQLATYVKLARSALASMPRDDRPEFLEQVNRQFNIKLVPIHPPYGEAMAPDRTFGRPANGCSMRLFKKHIRDPGKLPGLKFSLVKQQRIVSTTGYRQIP